MRTSLPPLGPILSGSAIWKLIGYQRSKVKEVKEFLSGCHLRLIKTRQTDEIPRHSPFLFKFLIFHSSEASPVAWWLMSKKSARKNWQINLSQFNILRIIVSLINIFDCLQKFNHNARIICIYVLRYHSSSSPGYEELKVGRCFYILFGYFNISRLFFQKPAVFWPSCVLLLE